MVTRKPGTISIISYIIQINVKSIDIKLRARVTRESYNGDKNKHFWEINMSQVAEKKFENIVGVIKKHFLYERAYLQ